MLCKLLSKINYEFKEYRLDNEALNTKYATIDCNNKTFKILEYGYKE